MDKINIKFLFPQLREKVQEYLINNPYNGKQWELKGFETHPEFKWGLYVVPKRIKKGSIMKRDSCWESGLRDIGGGCMIELKLHPRLYNSNLNVP